jgi:hypothetical protein
MQMTGAGFYTTFAIPAETRALADNHSFTYGDVIAEIPGLEFGAGFLLFVRNGVLQMLEGYCYDEPWPESILDFKLAYISGENRDMKNVRAILQT